MKNKGITPKELNQFLDSLAATANVTVAARIAKIGRSQVYARRRADPVFAEQWDEAMEIALDTLEAEAWRRAVEGAPEPVVRGGEVVAEVRKYSDGLLAMLLRAHRPDRFSPAKTRGRDKPGGDDGPAKAGVLIVPGMTRPADWQADPAATGRSPSADDADAEADAGGGDDQG